MKDVINYYWIISGFPTLLVIIEFFYFINNDKRLLRWGTVALEIMILVIPLALLRKYETASDVSIGTALFPPAYGQFIFMLIILCLLVYFYCSCRKRMGAPLLEVLVNCFLLIGIALNIVIAIQLASLSGIFFICLPAALLFVLMLVHNHRLLKSNTDQPAEGRQITTCLYLLQMRPVAKVLLLVILCLPVIVWLIKMLVVSTSYSYYNY